MYVGSYTYMHQLYENRPFVDQILNNKQNNSFA